MTTKTDPLSLLASYLGYAGHDIAAHQFAPAKDLDLFVRNNWLVPAGYPAALPCEACDEPHSVEVVSKNCPPYGLCLRTGETFPIMDDGKIYRIDAVAVAGSLASSLNLDGTVRQLRGSSCLLAMGGTRIHDTRVNIFFIPGLDRLDAASSVLQAVANQSGSITAALIVASETLDQIHPLAQRNKVILLRDIAQIHADGRFVIDETSLARIILPENALGRRLGAPSRQRDRIIPILDEFAREGGTIDNSNQTCRLVRSRYRELYDDAPPANGTIRSAVRYWRGDRSDP